MTAPTAPSVRRLRSTARAMVPFPEPESWLDVETGDADFPEAARTFFPYTAFDGLDLTPRVLHAQAVERLEEGYQGRLTDPRITARLRARYDVVSLLNRHADPEELEAALAVLRPGGHLLVESPDDPRPELESRGCTVLATTRRSAHVPDRLTARLPGTLPPRVSGPLTSTARALDHALALLLAGTRFAKTYRVIARKEPTAPQALPTAAQNRPAAPQDPPSAAQSPPAAPQGLPAAPQDPPSAAQIPPAAPQDLPSAPQSPPAAPQGLPAPPQNPPAVAQGLPSVPLSPPSARQGLPSAPQNPPAPPQNPPSAP
ncbi:MULTISPECIES: methyltransferase domain-containing protein [unclassified Streptomyces]|uniref:methyltransferase domain-containing protein n=1 Tax=unclassified Streptomyces TaxID=2593676 RepID=UPI0024735560|nr:MULTISPECIES: methyltransferase domain-containing protein [unclassified Streptomyces]MDH6449391.1 SAM-dependent methyltransferase [Streptomyces sp. SAI-119]MDH6500027.1 SAM-dependent methyltransferase [Streptomyces sp. SAI-149]